MKIKSATVLNDGASEALANEVYDKIGKFASYGFNKSHAVEYALISYQTMWLKMHYPVEFWAGVMSMLKEERRDLALAEMKRMGVVLLPPDVNNSLDRFTALNDATLLAPFSAIKGISEKAAAVIMKTRDEGGLFISAADFAKRVPARSCNSAARDKLDKVGAFSRIELGQLPADHADRRRDQVELMPGLISDAVIIDKEMNLDPVNLVTLAGLVEAWKACDKCDLKGLCHPKPMVTANARFMVVLDAPSFKEEGADEMGHGGSAESIEKALETAGLAFDEAYITAFVKSPKPKAGFPMSALSECATWLEEEIRVMQPPVVVICGSEAFKYFFKGVKGGMNEHTGRVVFDAKRGLNLLVGMNPGAIYFQPQKQEVLDQVMQKLPELLPYR